jgi:hypothetical protein
MAKTEWRLFMKFKFENNVSNSNNQTHLKI